MNKLLEIIHLDSLGQGVAKCDNEIYFIPKTLPGEKVYTEVLNKSKGVHFCSAPTEVTQKAETRTDPSCPHFAQCNGCHYLHTDYQNEWKQKTAPFKRAIAPIDAIKEHPAPHRSHYRNRIQLHYNKRKNAIGLIDLKRENILPIPECLVADEKILSKLKEIYQNQDSYLNQAKKARGHLELSLASDGSVKTIFDQHYSFDGFRQVFKEMNEQLKNALKNQSDNSQCVVDLFGGDGNLSECLEFKRRFVLDSYPGIGDEFFKVNLYSKKAIKQVEELKSVHKINCDTLIIDPPRSGLKNIDDFTKVFSPQKIIYVSCNWQTQIRDLKKIFSEYSIDTVEIFDFFPSTYHFETMITLQKN